VTPAQIAQSALDAAKAGAAIVHIHVRDPQTTKPSMDGALYREWWTGCARAAPDVVINLTTGPGARFLPGPEDPWKPGPATNLKNPAERVKHVVELRPEICSLDMGSMNMAAMPSSIRRVISKPWRSRSATPASCRARGVRAGHLLLAAA